MKPLNKTIILILITLLALALTIYPPFTVRGKQVIETENIQTAPKNDHAVDLAKSIAYIETSGTLNCSMVGKNGEKGCHQYMPNTWASYSKDVFGYVALQTPENAQKVTEAKMREWIAQGLTDRQIFLLWNQGHPGQCIKGVNAQGVRYDSCAYAESALKVLQKISTGA